MVIPILVKTTSQLRRTTVENNEQNTSVSVFLFQIPEKIAMAFCWFPQCLLINEACLPISHSVRVVTQVSHGRINSRETLRPVRAEGACFRTRSVDSGGPVGVTHGQGSAC